MAKFPNFHQMPKGSYPLNAHPIYALVGRIKDIIVTGIRKINGVLVSRMSHINKVSTNRIKSVNKVDMK
jgi:hypothetical protein